MDDPADGQWMGVFLPWNVFRTQDLATVDVERDPADRASEAELGLGRLPSEKAIEMRRECRSRFFPNR